ncbi:MAG: hypothetical protein ABFS45_09330 [Pseudomonadota bacterium]
MNVAYKRHSHRRSTTKGTRSHIAHSGTTSPAAFHYILDGKRPFKPERQRPRSRPSRWLRAIRTAMAQASFTVKVFHGAIEHHFSVFDTSRLWGKGRLCFL